MKIENFEPRQEMNEKLFEFHHYVDEHPVSVEPHQHDFYEVYFFLSGDVRYNIEGKEYLLQKGDILLTSHEDIHYPHIAPGKIYERIVFWLATDFFERVTDLGDDLRSCFVDAVRKDYRLIRPDQFTYQRLFRVCEELSQLKESDQIGNSALASAKLIEFLVYLSRAYYNTSESVRKDVAENERVNQILEYINNNLSQELTLQGLTKRFYISQPYMCRKFKQCTGMAIYQYIMKKRLTLARDMIRSGEPVLTACYDCGFKDYSNFLKAYKREYGHLPRDTR